MAATPVAVPVAEYLRTVYRPDRDYVDGEILERNMGEKPHARLQRILLLLLEGFAADYNAEVFPEQRLQISPTRYRVPDLMLVSAADTDPRIVRTAPLLCVEILSSEDRMRKIEERLQDYAALGVPSMWVIDPWRRVAYAANQNGLLQEARESLTVAGTAIDIQVAPLFAELDRREARAERS